MKVFEEQGYTKNFIKMTDSTLLRDVQRKRPPHIFRTLGEREVGYWFGWEFWGKGIATQVLSAFLAQVTIRPLYAHVAKHTIASQRVLEKCGFVVSGQDKGFLNVRGEKVEEMILMLS